MLRQSRFIGLVFITLAVLFPFATQGIPLGHSDQRAVLMSRMAEETFGNDRGDEELSKGVFLVAGRGMRDPRFIETVLLLIKHEWDGTVGLIINRSTEVKLSEVFRDNGALKERTDSLYMGGPVGQDRMFLLLRSDKRVDETFRIFEGVHVSTSRNVLDRLLSGGKTGTDFRVYAGYAGWAPGQLEQELAKGDWHIVKADADAIFKMRPSEVWRALLPQKPVIRL